MKKTLIAVLITFLYLSNYSQISSSNILINLEGNYNKSDAFSGVTTNNMSSSIKSLNLGFSIGYFISKNIIIGGGVDYIDIDDERNQNLSLTNLIHAERMNIKQKAYLPKLYISYYKNIFKNLYFIGTIEGRYGEIKTNLSTRIDEARNFTGYNLKPNEESRSGSMTSIENTDNYYSASFSPELSYYITNYFAIHLSMGGIGYSKIDDDNSSSQFLVNFNPANWEIGFSIKL